MDLTDKIKKIEALISGAKSEGERQAAAFAKDRLREKFLAVPQEYTVTANSRWEKKLFVAICQKHALHTYRYAKQKYTTTMVRVSEPFMNQILWPEFQKHSKLFDQLAQEIMDDLISKIHLVNESDEAVIVGELPLSTEAATL